MSIPGGKWTHANISKVLPLSGFAHPPRPWLFPGRNFYSAPFWFIIMGDHISPLHVSTPSSSFPHRCELPSARP